VKQDIPLWLLFSLSQFLCHNQIPEKYQYVTNGYHSDTTLQEQNLSFSFKHDKHTGKFVKVDVPQYLSAAKS